MTDQSEIAQADLVPGREFLGGGGEMGVLTRAFDWEATGLGPPESWPLSLRTTVRLLLNTRHPMFIWWGPDLIQFYNDAYARTMGPERHPGALGQPGRECWEEIWDIIGPQIEYVMAGRGATWHEDHLVPVTRFGRREDVWWTYGFSPIDDGHGGVGGVLVVCNDVTAQHNAGERIRELFRQAPGFIAVLKGPDHVFELCNDAYAVLVGHREVVGRRFVEALPEMVGQGVVARLDRVFASGEAHVASARPTEFADADGEIDTRYLDLVYQPIVAADGRATGIFVQGHDVTEQTLAEEHRQLLTRELNHRIKNMFAMVKAIANQTMRGGISLDEARDSFGARLTALSRSQDALMNDQWQGADLERVVLDALEHHAGGESRIRIEGPRVRLGPRAVTSMAMALHELSTNAAKYGALSHADGRVDVNWKVQSGDGSERRLYLTWIESNGPPVAEPSRRGFGSRLIERSLAMELDGDVRIDFRPAGVVCTIGAPMEKVAGRT